MRGSSGDTNHWSQVRGVGHGARPIMFAFAMGNPNDPNYKIIKAYKEHWIEIDRVQPAARAGRIDAPGIRGSGPVPSPTSQSRTKRTTRLSSVGRTAGIHDDEWVTLFQRPVLGF
jgi:hypothetical protein